MRQGLRQKIGTFARRFGNQNVFGIFVRRILVGSFVSPCRHGNLHRTFLLITGIIGKKALQIVRKFVNSLRKRSPPFSLPAADNRHSGNLIAVHRINAFTLSALTRATMLLDSILKRSSGFTISEYSPFLDKTESLTSLASSSGKIVPELSMQIIRRFRPSLAT